VKLTRRSFLKVSAATTGGLAALGATGCKRNPVLNSLTEDESGSIDGGEWKATTCQGCTTWCPVEVKVVDGRAIKVKGNRYSKAHNGNVCPRGHMSLQQVYDPDRIKVPMKRTNPKKGRNEDPKFVPITWDEAIEEIADKMLELRKNNETHKYVTFRGRYTYMRDILYGKFTKIFGSPNGISHSAICAEAEKFGSYYTESYWGYRDYDLENTKYVLLWGADPLASNRQVPHSINAWGDVLDQAGVAVMDPRLSATAAKADEWLPVIPGEDGALAIAMAHVILAKGLWNREFVGDFVDGKNRFKTGEEVDESTFKENYTNGVVKWWNLELKDKTPQWAAKRSGIPAEQIERVATDFAKAGPNVISWLAPGASMHVRGGYTAMAAHALNGLVGSVDNKGGSIRHSDIPVDDFPGYKKYLDKVAKKGLEHHKMDQRGYKEFPALKKGKSGKGVVTNNAADAILDEDPYEIKVAIGYWNNFAFSCSGTDRWEEALAKLPFFVHITTNPAEMTQFADIVLPAAQHKYEKFGYVKSKANTYAYVTMNQPVIEPLWDVKMDETEVPWLIAEKMAEKGYDKLLKYFKEEIKDPETGKSPTNEREFSEYALKIRTRPLWDPKIKVNGDQINGWEELRKLGVWNSEPYKFKQNWDDFGTKTGKFEFYSETLKKALGKHAKKHHTDIDDILETCKYEARGELAFVPHYEEAYRWGEEREYPFIFFEHRSRLNREARSANCNWYQELKDVDPGDEAWNDVAKINPKDARRLGIKTGDKIKLISPTGEIECEAKLWEGVRPGTVGKCYGQGHWAYGKVASEDYKNKLPRGGNNNEILPPDYERLSGSTARHGGVARIKIEKI